MLWRGRSLGCGTAQKAAATEPSKIPQTCWNLLMWNSPILRGTRGIVLLSSWVWKDVNGWALEIGISCTYSNPVVTGGWKHTHTHTSLSTSTHSGNTLLCKETIQGRSTTSGQILFSTIMQQPSPWDSLSEIRLTMQHSRRNRFDQTAWQNQAQYSFWISTTNIGIGVQSNSQEMAPSANASY